MFKKIARPKTATGKKQSTIKNIGSFIIFGFICSMFIFLGVPFGQNSSIGGSVALVDGEVISVRDYQNAINALQEQSGGGAGEEEGQDRMRRDAFNQLVNTEVMAGAASDFGIVVGREELKNEIKGYPSFQEDGRFARTRYSAFLEATGYSPKYFESKIKKQIASSSLQTMFSRVIKMSQMEGQKNQQLRKVKIEVSFVDIPYTFFEPHEEEQFRAMVESDMNLNGVNQILKDKEKAWQKTGSFDLRRTRLPKVQGRGRLFQLVLDHLPKKGLIPKIVKLRDKSYVLKIDSFEEDVSVAGSSNKEATLSAMDSATQMISQVILSQTLFQSWLSMRKSKAQLKVNSKIVGPSF